MRYTGGVLGGGWLTSLAATSARRQVRRRTPGQQLRGAEPVQHLLVKDYNLWSRSTPGPSASPSSEKWWGGHVETSTPRDPVDRRSSSSATIGHGRDRHQRWPARVDLRNIRTPIVASAPRGDNITPPRSRHSANWIMTCTSVDERSGPERPDHRLCDPTRSRPSASSCPAAWRGKENDELASTRADRRAAARPVRGGDPGRDMPDAAVPGSRRRRLDPVRFRGRATSPTSWRDRARPGRRSAASRPQGRSQINLEPVPARLQAVVKAPTSMKPFARWLREINPGQTPSAAVLRTPTRADAVTCRAARRSDCAPGQQPVRRQILAAGRAPHVDADRRAPRSNARDEDGRSGCFSSNFFLGCRSPLAYH